MGCFHSMDVFQVRGIFLSDEIFLLLHSWVYIKILPCMVLDLTDLNDLCFISYILHVVLVAEHLIAELVTNLNSWLMRWVIIFSIKLSYKVIRTLFLKDSIYSVTLLFCKSPLCLFVEIDSAYGDDCQPRYHSVMELRRTRVIWKNCLILSFTLWVLILCESRQNLCFHWNLHLMHLVMKTFI